MMKSVVFLFQVKPDSEFHVWSACLQFKKLFFGRFYSDPFGWGNYLFSALKSLIFLESKS